MKQETFTVLAGTRKSGQIRVFRSELPDPPASEIRTVCVVGLGYIGLPTAATLAQRGYRVHGVDVRQEVVESIGKGQTHIHEPKLPELVREMVESGRLTASLEPCEADVFLICVPTPFQADRSPDLSFVRRAGEAVRPFIRKGNLVILESTSPPGTTEEVVAGSVIPDGFVVGEDVHVAYCPERVLPGRIMIEVVQNDRVIGGVTPECTRRVRAFYETFVVGEVLATSARTAEMVKLVENAYRDVNIAFANELSMMAESLDVDALEIIELANHHPRVNVLTPGPGVGGHCISVDPWFLIHAAPEFTPLIRTAREVNDSKPAHVIRQIRSMVDRHGLNTIGCLGITYKADVDDIRESPSLAIVKELMKQEIGNVLVCDPYMEGGKFTDFPLHPLGDVLQRSDLLVLLTDHVQFRSLSRELLHNRHAIDPRGTWRNARQSGAAESQTTSAAVSQTNAMPYAA